jgi:hypothetical protein
MEGRNTTIILLLLLTVCTQSCGQTGKRNKIETYDNYRNQKLEYRDSLLVIYTVKRWHDSNWHTFEDVSLMYRSSNEQISYFIGGVFYSSDKLKMIVWVGEKEPNAATIEEYNKEKPSANRICPQGKDTFYSMGAIIGFREDTNKIWNLYPLDNELASCFSTKEQVINVMGQYYFREMKSHEMWKIVETGPAKGTFELKAYGYNLNDKGFWEKCWLWQKDTVGSNGLYPFQVWSYGYGMVDTCFQCATSLKPPEIDYPQEIVRMYEE